MKRLVPPDPAWPELFEREAARLAAAARGALIRLHHIGSTSVPGLCAKNIIDILGEAPSLASVDYASGAFVALGYEARGEYGIAGRRYFSRPPAAVAPGFHLHVFQMGSPEITRHLALRDFVRRHGDARDGYAALKHSLSGADGSLAPDYQERKAAFVAELELRALAHSIRAQERT